MCDCHKEIDEKLTARFKEMQPDSSEHKVKLMGYGIVLGEKGCVRIPFMEYETFALKPLKKGGSKPQKTTGNMFFSFCPFCGEKVAK